MDMPSRLIIKYLGGFKMVATIVERDVSSIYRWHDRIPAKHQASILNYAREHGIDLRPDDFFYPDRLQLLMQEKQTPPTLCLLESSGVHAACVHTETLQP
ncbi:hypothetical protein AL470_003010 [Bartonella henselae str. Houston-1]|nr:hypothetical protein AL470_003010 [Bartonella henselae str. Houston-1]